MEPSTPEFMKIAPIFQVNSLPKFECAFRGINVSWVEGRALEQPNFPAKL